MQKNYISTVRPYLKTKCEEMLHLHLETNYKIFHYRQKKPAKADYPSSFFFNYKNQRRVIASVVMNLRITWKDGKLLSINTNKMQLVIEFIIPKFTEGLTCFERHTAHHQEL
jgi:hypothetical protein